MSARVEDVHVQVDARDLLCPMPVIRTQQAVEPLGRGALVEIICTDPGAREDIPAWCRINGHEVLSITEQAFEIRMRLRVGDRR